MSLPTLYQDFIHISRYARWNEKERRRETWDETIDRYITFMSGHLESNHNYKMPQKLIKEIRGNITDLKVMPSMRALWAAGKALNVCHVAAYNCAYVPIDKLRSFDEILYILMCGTGVGFSVEKNYTRKLPTICEDFENTDTVITVTDSKIGWCKAYRELLSLLVVGSVPRIDYSKIRPKGDRLKTFGGRAAGPDAFKSLCEYTISIFRNASGRKLYSIEAHDIVCKIADVVVCGGVRRSALLSASDLTDDRMRAAKMGQWYMLEPQRALANNSTAYRETPDMGTFMEEWLSLYRSKSGERGIVNRVAMQKKASMNGRRDYEWAFGTNPCCLPAGTMVETDSGRVPIEEIAESPQNFKVLSYNTTRKELEYVTPIEAGLTRRDAELIELDIETDEGDMVLRLTPDHLVYTENRGYVEAEQLTHDDELVFL